jgi:hypothetical protein
MAAPQPEPAYTVTRYDCKTQLDDINTLAAQADTEQSRLRPAYDPPDFNYLTRFQKSRFIAAFDYRVMPWTSGCEGDDAKISVRHYVAQMKDGDKEIVGWMVAERKKRFNKTYIYLSEISTIRIRSSSYRGIGDALLGQLKADAEADPMVAFVFLYPLRPELEDVYKRRGYRNYKELTGSEQYPTVRHMFILNTGRSGGDIPQKLMNTLKAYADVDRPAIARVAKIAEDAVNSKEKVEGADELAQFVKSGLGRTLKKIPALMDEIRNALDNIDLFAEAGDPMTIQQQVQSILSITESVPEKLPFFANQLERPTRTNPAGIPAGPTGGRRTRRRKARKTRRRQPKRRKTRRRST